MMEQTKLYNLILEVADKLNLSVGQLVITQKTGQGTVKISKDGRVIVTFVYGETGLTRIKGVRHLVELVRQKLIEQGFSIDIYESPNKASVTLMECGGNKATHVEGDVNSTAVLLLEAFSDVCSQ